MRYIALIILLFGYIIPVNATVSEKAKSVEILRISCEKKKAQACLDYTSALYMGTYDRVNYPLARKYAKITCDLKEAEGCNFLAAMQEKGQGGAQNMDGAISNFDTACNMGNGGACNNLAQIIYDGRLTEQRKLDFSLDTARALYAKGCDKNIAISCNNYAVMLLQGQGGALKQVEARAFFDVACTAGNLDACANYGYMQLSGIGGPEDFAKASVLLQESCEKGHLLACDNWAYMMMNGLGVEKNLKSAETIFAKGCAANQGNSCYNLGGFYYYGYDGLYVIDNVSAYNYYKKRCDLGNPSACGKLAAMMIVGKAPIAKDK
ncbi:hypothetical protein LPB140_08840 [Sphingorhabdus lutea]|uniref:Uncharacterized protein n=1 Tax=Sphingorhabdus lutea TaxID=1913578 RepID=A0A1L3JCK0_9SPHN|nr:tetratricopeptide repeat protein [Sphingorhabdus lutea]APG62877.1 hypothetical protein LPB140_08840 [Sphingorhabdus lutea]